MSDIHGGTAAQAAVSGESVTMGSPAWRSRRLPLNSVGPLNELLRRDTRGDVSALRDDHNDLKNRVPRLGEARNTTVAEAQAGLKVEAAQQAALPPPSNSE